MFIFLRGHMLVPEEYWQVTWHAICWFVYGNLNVRAKWEKLQLAQDTLGIEICWLKFKNFLHLMAHIVISGYVDHFIANHSVPVSKPA
jgi:hypothetical protein